MGKPYTGEVLELGSGVHLTGWGRLSQALGRLSDPHIWAHAQGCFSPCLQTSPSRTGKPRAGFLPREDCSAHRTLHDTNFLSGASGPIQNFISVLGFVFSNVFKIYWSGGLLTKLSRAPSVAQMRGEITWQVGGLAGVAPRWRFSLSQKTKHPSSPSFQLGSEGSTRLSPLFLCN